MANSPSNTFVYATATDAEAFARRLVASLGVPPDDAATVARCLVLADLRGVDTHGLMRLPVYLDRVRRGLVDPKPHLVVERKTPVVGALDGQNGLGYVTATHAMADAIATAQTYGIGIVSVRRSTHFGMAATYVLQAIEAGMMSMVFSNASPAMPPWGGRDALLGTSPFAAGAPGGKLPAFVLDMAPSVAARGKIRKAERRGEKIPLGLALDAEGRPTTDPTAALGGVVLPIGGAKGSGLAIMMDIFAGVFSGSAFGGDVGDQQKVLDRSQNVGHFFLAMKPDLFVTEADYKARMDTLFERIRAAPRAAGFDEILLPGEPEAREMARRQASGIPYAPNEVEILNAEAAKAGVAPLVTSRGGLL
ncbi:MAG: Ldh family oxidoreductase [Hyphomicrobiaceae bacterium]